MTLVNARKILQSVLHDNSTSGQTPFLGLTIPTAVEPLLFLHAQSVISSYAKHKGMKMKSSYTTGNLAGLMVQSVTRTCRKWFPNGSLPLVLKALTPYILLDEAKRAILFSLSVSKATLS